MTEKERRLAGFSLLAKINVITGWSFPVEDTLQDVLHKQFVKVLEEKYSNCNEDEVDYAFRNYPVKDWGKNINLNLIDEVMTPYLDKRYESSLVEQQVKEKPTQKIYTDEEILNERRGEIELAYQNIKKGRTPILYPYFKEVLVSDGFMDREVTLQEFFDAVLDKNIECIYKNC